MVLMRLIVTQLLLLCRCYSYVEALWISRIPSRTPSILHFEQVVSSISSADNNFTTTTISPCSKNQESPAVSPHAALDQFLSVCANWNEKQEGSINIVSRGSSKLPKHQTIETFVFTTSEDDCVIAIVADAKRVDPFKLETSLSRKVESVPLVNVQSTCGFAPGTIPPLGHSSPNSVSIVLDEDLLEKCQTNDLMLLGGGGNAYWQSLVSTDTMLLLPNVQVASISEEAANEDTSVNPTLLPASSTSLEDMTTPKPFSMVEAPPIHISELVIQQRELSNPLTPSLVTVVGRVGKLDVKGKRLVHCELLPLKDDKEATDDKDDKSGPRPWRSGNHVDMAVQLIFGKMLLTQLGTTQGEAAIQNLKEGLVIQVQARTNVGNRESLANWVAERTLDLVVLDYQTLTNGESNGALSAPSKAYKNKPKSHFTASSLPSLTLKNIFHEAGGSVHLVDDVDSIRTFVEDYSKLQSQLEATTKLDSQSDTTSSATMVGIDCEWQPSQFMDPGEPQPVLLMQISLQALQKVFLFDFQSLLRPLLPPEDPMNEIEAAVSDVLSDLLSSKRILKVGYQLASDLRRIAASYPHVPCFQEVQSALEVSTLIKRILHITKQKKSRSITMSLARMTSHYLGKTVDKECQVSDWAARPLTQHQLDYAALDAAISPLLTEKVLESIQGRINGDKPLIERWDGDEGLAKEIDSWRFFFLQTEDRNAIKKLQAKQIVGSSWIVTQNWITGSEPPKIPSVPPSDGEEPYADTNGVLRLPSRMLSMRQPGDSRLFESLVGQRAGTSKDRCLGLFLTGGAALPEGARIDYPQRSGFTEFTDGVALFVNMRHIQGFGEPQSYPNEFFDNGKHLTWYLRSTEWRDGTSELSKKLLSSNTADDSAIALLFIRLEKGNFLSCGRCRVLPPDELRYEAKDCGLVQLNLKLLDYEALASCEDFMELVNLDSTTDSG